MQVSIETTSGLERRLTIGVPNEIIEKEVTKRLQDATKTVRINGFRKGKVPIKVVRQKYGAGVRQEVLNDTISTSFQDAVREKQVRLAGQPVIEPKAAESTDHFEYVAVFEVYPEIDLKGVESSSFTQLDAEITEEDIDEMLANLRKSKAEWTPVEREAKTGDQVTIDFVGKKDGEVFDGGSAEGHKLELGSGAMIPGFEAGIEGMKPSEEKVLSLTFPEDYQAEELQSADVEFTVTLNEVAEEELPELDEEFFKSFGVADKGEEGFREDIKANMEREKGVHKKSKVKNQVLDALIEANASLEVPAALVKNEIGTLRQQAMQQYGQFPESVDVESMLPDDLFKENAERRTRLGLLVAEVVKNQNIQVEQEKVKTLVEEIASTYEDPESVINYYYGNQELLAGAEAAVLEDQVVDYLLSTANIETKSVPYQELIKQES